MKNGKELNDYLSPVLVKELRQGLRTRGFVGAFLLTQILMITSVWASMVAMRENDNPDEANAWFWFVVALPLLFLMPLRGFNAIGQELRNKTLELVHLTSLTSWRIVAGKWMSLVVQELLLCSAILPYLVLRYFVGGVNLFQDLAYLLLIVALSTVSSAMSVGLSAYNVDLKSIRSVRYIFPFLVTILFVHVVGAYVINASSRATGGFDTTFALLCLGLFGPPFILLMLVVGASRIAPVSANYSMKKRALGLFFLAECALFIKMGMFPALACGITFVIILYLSVDALTEDVRILPALYRPLLKLRSVSKRVAVLFYPGWIGGVPFLLLCSVLLYIIVALNTPTDMDDVLKFTVCLLGTILMPMPVVVLWNRKRMRAPVSSVYWGTQGVVGAIIGVTHAMISIAGTTPWHGLGVVPMASLMLLSDRRSPYSWELAVGTLVVILVLICIPMRRVLKQITEMISTIDTVTPPPVTSDSDEDE